jgi:hypothetical protein
MTENLDTQFWIEFVCSDYVPLIYEGKSYFLSTPSRESRFFAEEVFLECYRASLRDGVLSEDEIDKLLDKYDIWGWAKEDKLKAVVKDLENIKVIMYENWMNEHKIGELRKALASTNNLCADLIRDKQTFDSLSAKSAAQYCKQHFLLGCSIFISKKRPLWKNPHKCWVLPDPILNSAYIAINKYTLLDDDYREIARSSSWRNIWTTRKGNGSLFGKPVVDLSVAQRHLIAWSNLYDNVYKHSNCPDDVVINDNDLLDGWMIAQKRKHDAEVNKINIENSITNPKIANSEEIFICMDSVPVAGDGEAKFKAIYDMNDMGGKIAFKRRMDQIKREGYVEESNMIDRRIEIQRQAIRQGAH